MNITQAYEIANDVTKEVLGETAVLEKDLSNIGSIGETVFNANANDNYVKALVNRIGKTVFETRVYKGEVIGRIVKDPWYYGSVFQKIKAGLPEAQESEVWELQDGAEYSMDIFNAPKDVKGLYFNDGVAWNITQSITREQLKESFTSAIALGNFLDMILTKVENSLTLKIEGLARLMYASQIVDTIVSDYGSDALSSKSGVKAINLLKLYNTTFSESLTADKALYDKDFIRFASRQMRLVAYRMRSYSKLFNINGHETFTPTEELNIVMLNEFEQSAHSYLYADTFHDDEVKLPKASVVNYWQGTGTDYALASTSKVNVKSYSGNEKEVPYVLGIMYDDEAMMIRGPERSVDTHYNKKAHFWNYFYEVLTSFFCDQDNNFVVFFLA